ncbi:G-protein coupled receptor 20-like [Sorex araneus]|uniref:G-protein coupled receptor 20-like n=1 Tax=Sorex araneus TaxID=42254 RepID=UPI002433D323|nr:G-protein coupled receptor 20-like [Sorex araneus]
MSCMQDLGFEVESRNRLCCSVVALTVLEFLLPLLVLSAFTGRMVCALSRPGLLPQGRQRRVHAMQLLLTMLVIFLLCFTPFQALQVAVALWPDVPPPPSLVAYHVAVALSSLKRCLDLIVYCFVTSGFQATVRSLLGRPGADGEPSSRDVVGLHKRSKVAGGSHGPGHRALPTALTNGP